MIFDLIIVIGAFAVILVFKSLVIKFNLLIYSYPIFIIFLLKQGVEMSGILRHSIQEYIQYIDIGFYSSAMGYFFLVLILYPIRNLHVSFQRVRINEPSRYIMLCALILIGIIVWPAAFGIGGVGRFNLLPGGAWSSLYVLVSAMLILSSKGLKSWSTRLHLAICLFIIFRGERVDNLLCVISLLLFRGEEQKSEKYKLGKMLIFGLPFFIIVSLVRIVQILGFDFVKKNWLELMVATLYKQHTALDVTHVYLSSIAYYYEMPSKWYAIFNSLLSSISMNSSSLDYVFIVRELIPNAGGGLFYSEAVLAIGPVGVVLYTIVFGLVLKYSVKKQTLVTNCFAILFFLLSFRLQWYGGIYIVKLLWVLPLCIICLKLLTKSIKLNEEKKI